MGGFKKLNKFQKRQFHALLKAGKIEQAWKYIGKCKKINK
jgi:hypothetical protein